MARTRSSSGSGRGGARTAALVAAGLVALASTAAVVISDEPQVLRLAVVGALWAFVLAAFAAPRRRDEPPASAEPGGALELRRTYEIELEREVAARREYELQLEVYLRRELERGLVEEVQALREEVGRIRGEVIDRLDGELRMERIETTRLIGGSLRALQDEARRLGIGLHVPAELPGGSLLDEPAYPPGPPGPEPGGYGSPGYGSPGVESPGYGSPGYQPGGSADYGSPGYGSPGYPSPGYPAPAPEPAGLDVAGYGPASEQPPVPPYRPYADPLDDPLTSAVPPPAPSTPGLATAAPERGRGSREQRPAMPEAGPPTPPAGRSAPPRRRRAREDDEDNEVMSRLLGR